ncbi:type II toxin-antitoxin system VapC family toxin [Rubritalea profundi]|uniref:PIN domain-containing protein n=1 Tax=Rubritalea profundi TaxID=1658618 RepID=A0A2S7TXM6_9BACT|nr:type II toxin-antitoxin system VapC family toxin [Rubritalea profundi]PQJ27469.1 hypothetical protein BSZ32_02460 [Rubritalea profundi]
MRVLVDTHTLLWMLHDDPRLSAKAGQAILDAEEAYWSILSLWEIAIKQGLQKRQLYQLPDNWTKQIPAILRENQLQEISIKAEYCNKLTDLPLHHRDPFDRMLITTAQCEDLTLISRDSAFQHYDVKTLW